MYIPLLELVYPVLGKKKKRKGKERKRKRGGESAERNKHSVYFFCLLPTERGGERRADTQHLVKVR